MFQAILQKLAALTRECVPFDPSTLNDPVALETEWTPLVKGGTNMRTHKLAAISAQRIEFKPSAVAVVFATVFMLFGFGEVVLALVQLFTRAVNPSMVVFLLFGIIFTAAGAAMLRKLNTPVVFDTSLGYFWKGNMKPEEFFINTSGDALKNLVELHRVHALQVVAEYCRGNKSSYYSYELNLVLKDGKRVNVIDHGDIRKVRSDALQLSGFLKKPVWDATLTIPGVPQPKLAQEPPQPFIS